MSDHEAVRDRERYDDDETERLLGPARLAYFTPVREYPPLGDRKSVMVLSLCGLTVTVVCLFWKELEAMLAAAPRERWLVFSVLLAWLTCVLLAAGSSFRALVQPIPPMGRCTAYFRTIAATSLDDYRAALHGLSHRAAMREMLNYNHSIAVLSAEKFRLIGASVSYLCLALGFWMLLMILIASRTAHFWAV
jgi:hypothetical protein